MCGHRGLVRKESGHRGPGAPTDGLRFHPHVGPISPSLAKLIEAGCHSAPTTARKINPLNARVCMNEGLFRWKSMTN